MTKFCKDLQQKHATKTMKKLRKKRYDTINKKRRRKL